jgi:hypothetical protein
MEERWVGTEEGGEFIDAAAEDREDAWNVVASVGPSGQEDLNAGGEAFGVARVSLNDVVEGRTGIFGIAAVGVGAVIEKPLERFRFEILARREENGEPAPAESVNVGTVTDEKFHHRSAAGLRDTLEGHVVDQDLAEFGVGSQEFLDALEVVGTDGLLELTCRFEAIDMVLELGPAWETELARDLELSVGQGGGGAGTNQVFGLIAKMAEVGTIGKLHERILSICPVSA